MKDAFRLDDILKSVDALVADKDDESHAYYASKVIEHLIPKANYARVLLQLVHIALKEYFSKGMNRIVFDGRPEGEVKVTLSKEGGDLGDWNTAKYLNVK